MCRIFADQDPRNFCQVTRSIRLGGHATSVRLEGKFWSLIDQMAAEQSMTTPQFLLQLHDEAMDIHGDVFNFASLLRCACVTFLEQPKTVFEAQHHERLRVGSVPEQTL
ncbi:MAG: ribbon-helix-helix domain-containing protein [Rhodospirillales bacterium]|nr:ribbon-helix-helix domain-containing protein [Rhodospirillales bacterium]